MINLHLTSDKWSGGQFGNKPQSYQEILSLFPKGTIKLTVHNHTNIEEKKWVGALRSMGYADADIVWYGDYPGTYESQERIDASKLFKVYPRIEPSPVNLDFELPKKFFTTQWDSNETKRTLIPEKISKVMAEYKSQGYEAIVVGGKAKHPQMKNSLAAVAYAMGKAGLHVGVDSGFMHLAQCFLPHDKIHLYNEPSGFFSHHMNRAIDNGSPLNKHYNPKDFK